MIFNRRRALLWLIVSGSLLLVIYHISPSISGDKNRFESRRMRKSDSLVDERDVGKMLRAGKKQTEYIDKKGVHVVVGK